MLVRSKPANQIEHINLRLQLNLFVYFQVSMFDFLFGVSLFFVT